MDATYRTTKYDLPLFFIHNKVRSLLVTTLKRIPTTSKSTCQLKQWKRLKQPGQWGTHVELKAASGILKLPIYIYTSTSRADGQYAWNKIVPDSRHSEITNVPYDLNHIELCHTKDVHYDLIVLTNGTYPKDFPNYTMCM